jgi:hypothetical protein
MAPTTRVGGSARPRVLRIGILLGGTLVEERILRARTPVTIGQSIKNTFSIPLDGLPREFTLFAVDDGRYALRFLPTMDGRLSAGTETPVTLAALRASGATRHGDAWQVPLDDGARGRLSVGELTVLFQFVASPPPQPAPRLPASVRGTLADRVDPRLAVILGGALLATCAMVIGAAILDPERDDGLAARAEEAAFEPAMTMAFDLTPPPAAAAVVAPADVPADVPVDGTARGPRPPVHVPAARPGGNPVAPPDPGALRDPAIAFANVLAGTGGPGTTDGDMANRRPGAALGQELGDVRDRDQQVAIGGGTGRTIRDARVRVGTSDGPTLRGPDGVTRVDRPDEHAPPARILPVDRTAFDESTLTPDAVYARILASYMTGLKRCYTSYLKQDGAARGKVALTFGVSATGRATTAKAHGFATEVDDCIGGQMSTWRFPVPKDKDGAPTDASFAITLQLVPE